MIQKPKNKKTKQTYKQNKNTPSKNLQMAQ